MWQRRRHMRKSKTRGASTRAAVTLTRVSFDNTVNMFDYFTVLWNGGFFPFDFLDCNCDEALTFTLAAVYPSGSWSADAEGGAVGGLFGGSFVLGLGGFGAMAFNPTFTDNFATASGTYELIITSVPTPEPSSVALTLAGIGLVFAMRRRWTSGLQQASRAVIPRSSCPATP